jgi:hypothetical protein
MALFRGAAKGPEAKNLANTRHDVEPYHGAVEAFERKHALVETLEKKALNSTASRGKCFPLRACFMWCSAYCDLSASCVLDNSAG